MCRHCIRPAAAMAPGLPTCSDDMSASEFAEAPWLARDGEALYAPLGRNWLALLLVLRPSHQQTISHFHPAVATYNSLRSRVLASARPATGH